MHPTFLLFYNSKYMQVHIKIKWKEGKRPFEGVSNAFTGI